jgi:hypothetical protein
MPPESPAIASLAAKAPSAAELCGFLVLDKPAGLTSHGCVAQVRRAYGLKRVGHGGTLDPAVTGVLPIALGGATRLLPYLTGDKRYRGVVRLGLRTSSDDLSGEELEERPVPPLLLEELETALAPFRGTIQQRPPNVSAVHVDGERAYLRNIAPECRAFLALDAAQMSEGRQAFCELLRAIVERLRIALETQHCQRAGARMAHGQMRCAAHFKRRRQGRAHSGNGAFIVETIKH